ncbi:hypothetical protein ACSBR2_015811 [Camellia fascicularis]
MDISGTERLVESSPYLETLVVDMSTLYCPTFQFCSNFLNSYDLDGEQYWVSHERVFKCWMMKRSWRRICTSSFAVSAQECQGAREDNHQNRKFRFQLMLDMLRIARICSIYTKIVELSKSLSPCCCCVLLVKSIQMG